MSDGDVRRLDLDDREPLALYKLDGRFYATDGICTHGQALLADGVVEDGLIVCPYHLGSFDIRTGEAVARPCTVPLRTYRVTVRDHTVIVDVPDLTPNSAPG